MSNIGRPLCQLQMEKKYASDSQVGYASDYNTKIRNLYGDILEGESDENYPINPSSYYSATKASADMLVKSAYRTYGLPYIITRTCNNYGPNQHEEKYIPKLVKCIKEEKEIPVYTPGTQVREWIHVADNCKAIYNLMISDKINEIYN